MKDVLKIVGIAFGVALVLMVLFAFTSAGTLFIQSYIYPEWLSVQRLSVESSKSFVDSNNIQLSNLQTEYYRLDTKKNDAGSDQNSVDVYTAQQEAVLGQMCMKINAMKANTVSPEISLFVMQHGGCK